ncbi:MAG: MtnX-like HAD-IB family phosphatase [Rhodocyclales bacterium]|nr:MtnX-like HAD-IB family phosphatase [Rhodocyclales bacterium]
MLFVIDFDGTLARKDTVDTLLEQFAPAAWKDVEQKWLLGHITAVECMGQQIRMVRASRETLEEFFQSIELDASFLPFYHHVCRHAAVAIVSDGLDHPIQIATHKAGLPNIPVFANRLHYVANGIDISFPHLDTHCAAGNGVCKCAVARDLAQPLGGPMVLIGDGKSDTCLAHRADIVFAKKSLRRYCEEQGIEHIPFDSFADVLAVVRKWDVHPPERLSLVA